MWVKICANTSLHDTRLAIEAGADAVGFVLAPSKRQVTVEQVAAITQHLPATVETVGVYTTHGADEILAAHHRARLHTVQLHGAFSPELLHQLRSRLPAAAIIQAISWPIDPGENALAEVSRQLDQLPPGSRVLIDSKLGHQTGGTGRAFDWAAAGLCLARYRQFHYILAGGLTPSNVAHAIDTLHPWGVDVAGGVEAAPGRKDPQRTADFILNAKRPLAVTSERP